MKLRIKEIAFKAGSSTSAPPLAFSPSAVTVFVGPNYSGKSRAISEIMTKVQSGTLPTDAVMLTSVTFDTMTEGEARDVISKMETDTRVGETLFGSNRMFGRKHDRFQADPESFARILTNPQSNETVFAQWFSRHQALLLNGNNRINLINEQTAGDMQSEAHTSFQEIFRNDDLRARLSDIVHGAFGLYLTVDPTNLGQLRLRLSETKSSSVAVERGLTQESIEFHGRAALVTNTSDGAKAFVGIMSEILAGDPNILLIDEPEAFLHPSLAFTLGKEISQEVVRSSKQMFVSTHSASFIMGCLQSGVDVNVVRVTYRNNVATARLLSSDDLKRMMRNPLLRSIGVVSALFYESVIVTESDADRAFYQEVNERLLREGRGRGIPNAIFLNAQNKQTIPVIIEPLRRLGIPAAAIYDVDLVKDGGRTATSFMSSAGIPEIAQHPLTQMRSAVHEALKSTGVNFKTGGGINVLQNGDRQAAQDYLDQLRSYGAFVIPTGELEFWLKGLGISGHGPAWLISMFERMGENPSEPDYVLPGEGDVWEFMEQVRVWLHDPARKGIPI